MHVGPYAKANKGYEMNELDVMEALLVLGVTFMFGALCGSLLMDLYYSDKRNAQ